MPRTANLRILIAALPLLILMAISTPSRAQYPVNDASNIEQTTKVAQEAANQLSRLTDILGKVTSLKDAVGPTGGPSGIAGVLTGSKTLSGLDLRLPTFNGLAPPADTTAANLRNYAIQGFFVTDQQADSTARINAEHARKAAQTEAELNGYAVATEARADAANTPTYAGNITGLAGNAQNLRQDVAALTAATLGSLERLNQIQAVLAAMLEIEATQTIGKAPSVYRASDVNADATADTTAPQP